MTGPDLVVLDETACRRRLAANRFGRVALSVGALPVVFPVHYALLDGDPVFRTDAGTKLAAASSGNVLCLEIDEVNAEDHTGWSVLVTGRAEVLSDPETLARAADLPLRPWVGHGDAFVRIHGEVVSGRLVSSVGHDLAVALEDQAPTSPGRQEPVPS